MSFSKEGEYSLCRTNGEKMNLPEVVHLGGILEDISNAIFTYEVNRDGLKEEVQDEPNSWITYFLTRHLFWPSGR